MVELSGAIKAGLLGGFVTGLVFSSVLRIVGKLENCDEILSYKFIFYTSVVSAFICAIVFGILCYWGIFEYLF